MMSTCSQSAPFSIVSEQAAPKAAKSADKMEGAMIACGAIELDVAVISEFAQYNLEVVSNQVGEMVNLLIA